MRGFGGGANDLALPVLPVTEEDAMVEVDC